MTRRRVKITGVGFATPAGIGRDAFTRGILESKSRVVELPALARDGITFVGAEMPDFRLLDWMPETVGKRVARQVQFALVAAKLAVLDAGLEFIDLKRLNPVVMGGSSLMASDVVGKAILSVERKGIRFASPRSVFQAPVSAISVEIANLINGVVRTQSIQSACCAGIDSIGHAASLVAEGEADIAVCGGTEAPLVQNPMAELRAAGLSPSASSDPARLCRPFDRWRTTGAIGEGAGFVVLEPESSPRPGYAWLSGYSYATDTDGSVAKGLAKAITLAIRNASISPSAIDHLSCWGPGHPIIDKAESDAVHSVFGPDIANLPAYSIKGAIGNPLGAAGAIQVGCAALGMRNGFLPPTVNWEFPDPACRLHLSNQARFIRTSCALINAHGLSGTNSAIILEKC